jgi:tRNA(fMet)-specific endonuclease VapC
MKAKNKKYLLDTNILIDFMSGIPVVTENVLKAGTQQCCMSVISLHELYYGACLAREKKEEYYEMEIKKINKLLEYFMVLPVIARGEEYARIKYTLKQKGKPVDEFDMIIAGQALSEGLTIVTDNMKHFENMPDIKTVNWMVH